MQLTKEIFTRLKEGVVFFENFNDGELLALLKSTQREVFEDNEIVFKEGTRGDKMYIVITGQVRISRSIGRNQEEAQWTDISLDRFINDMAHAGILEGLRGIQQGLGLDVAGQDLFPQVFVQDPLV